MEYPFSSREKRNGYCVSPRSPMENQAPLDCGARNSISEDLFDNFSDLLNFDTYAGWCNSPSATDQMFASYGLSLFQSIPYAFFDSSNVVASNSSAFPEGGGTSNAIGSSFNCGDRIVFQQRSSDCYTIDPNGADDSVPKQSSCFYGENNNSGMSNSMVSRTVPPSLDEKMLRALSFFKESSGGGILAQVWVPIKRGDKYILSTSDQPYLLDQMLAGYREVSGTFTFSAETKPGTFLGLPGRVFSSKVPEWTSNVSYYKEAEYVRVTHAVNHAVRSSIALPVFQCPDMSCCAVLEIVNVKEKPNFDTDMENICHALQCISRNQKAALAEITDVLRALVGCSQFCIFITCDGWIKKASGEEKDYCREKCACLHEASVPIFFIFFGKLINIIGLAYLFPKTASHKVAKYSLDFVYVSVAILFSSWIEVSCWMYTGESQAAKMRMAYLRSMLNQDISVFDTEASTGEVISAITSDIIVVQDALSEKILKDFLICVEQDLGPWGPLLLAFAYIPLTILAVPASVLTLGGGYLFGLPVGFIADSFGTTFGPGAAFLLGRTIGKPFVSSKLDYPQFRSVAIAIRRSGFKVCVLLFGSAELS